MFGFCIDFPVLSTLFPHLGQCSSSNPPSSCHVVMPRFGPEPKFEPEPGRTWPKSGSKFKKLVELDWNQVLQCNITWTVTNKAKVQSKLPNRTGPGFKVRKFAWTGPKVQFKVQGFQPRTGPTGPRHHYVTWPLSCSLLQLMYPLKELLRSANVRLHSKNAIP